MTWLRLGNRETDKGIAEEGGWGWLVVAGEEFICEIETPCRHEKRLIDSNTSKNP